MPKDLLCNHQYDRLKDVNVQKQNFTRDWLNRLLFLFLLNRAIKLPINIEIPNWNDSADDFLTVTHLHATEINFSRIKVSREISRLDIGIWISLTFCNLVCN